MRRTWTRSPGGVLPRITRATHRWRGDGRGVRFDVQAHQGGRGRCPQGTLAAFADAMELGVSTLELDVQITADGVAVVTHDRQVSGERCADTQPAFPGDPDFPYVGKYIVDLTLAQVKMLNCDVRRPAHPSTDPCPGTVEPVPGAPIPTLHEVFDLVERYASDVWLNIETKFEAAAPWETATREEFVRVTLKAIRDAGFLDRVTIQSFDWRALMRMHEVEPRLPIVALVSPDFLGVGEPGPSAWLGGIDIKDFDGDWVAAAHSLGADAVSPLHGTPQTGTVTEPGYVPFTTADTVASAHELGMAVIPWTVNDAATMSKLIDDGVDGIITDYPDVLRAVMAGRGLRLPEGHAVAVGLPAHCGGATGAREQRSPALVCPSTDDHGSATGRP